MNESDTNRWTKQSKRKDYAKQEGPVELLLADHSQMVLEHPQEKNDVVNPEDVIMWRKMPTWLYSERAGK